MLLIQSKSACGSVWPGVTFIRLWAEKQKYVIKNILRSHRNRPELTLMSSVIVIEGYDLTNNIKIVSTWIYFIAKINLKIETRTQKLKIIANYGR